MTRVPNLSYRDFFFTIFQMDAAEKMIRSMLFLYICESHGISTPCDHKRTKLANIAIMSDKEISSSKLYNDGCLQRRMRRFLRENDLDIPTSSSSYVFCRTLSRSIMKMKAQTETD